MLNGNSSFTRLLLVLSLVSAPIQLNGCATIFTGTTDTLKFNANVPGVRLTIDGEYKGELPLTLTMSRNFMNGQQFKAKFEAAGHETQEFQLKREFNYVAILDITSIPTSGGIDLLTGSLMKFSPDEYHVQMLKKGGKPGSAEFERSKRLYRYALMNYRKVQLDIVHGGGEYLESLASALSGTRGGADSVITEQALRNAPVLLEASGAHDFIRRFNDMLAGHPSLRVYQM
ncbi:MAG: hypothetical protein E6H75_06735 [Betaproteobacteria bacterium]|nr:MAG: hypothetical protein E6H75_06735 [Betaproteobacteria bacterium]